MIRLILIIGLFVTGVILFQGNACLGSFVGGLGLVIWYYQPKRKTEHERKDA